MIAPSYRREQLWAPPRRSRGVGLAFGLAFGFVVAIDLFVPDGDFFAHPDTPEDIARMTIAKLVYESYPEWRDHHAGCPHQLSDLLPDTHLDPWGHAMHYTCDPRLASGGRFAVISAGEDGVFGTSDDIENHQ